MSARIRVNLSRVTPSAESAAQQSPGRKPWGWSFYIFARTRPMQKRLAAYFERKSDVYLVGSLAPSGIFGGTNTTVNEDHEALTQDKRRRRGFIPAWGNAPGDWRIVEDQGL